MPPEEAKNASRWAKPPGDWHRPKPRSSLKGAKNFPAKGMPESDVASTYLSLLYHVIFATRHRAPSIVDAWREDLHAYLGGVLKGLDAYPLAVGGTADHVHIFFGAKSTHRLADLVRDTKTSSQKWALEKWESFHWQEGYAAFSVSPGDVSRVVDYISRQEEHHRHFSSQDELRALLTECGMEIDERFFE